MDKNPQSKNQYSIFELILFPKISLNKKRKYMLHLFVMNF